MDSANLRESSVNWTVVKLTIQRLWQSSWTVLINCNINFSVVIVESTCWRFGYTSKKRTLKGVLQYILVTVILLYEPWYSVITGGVQRRRWIRRRSGWKSPFVVREACSPLWEEIHRQRCQRSSVSIRRTVSSASLRWPLGATVDLGDLGSDLFTNVYRGIHWRGVYIVVFFAYRLRTGWSVSRLCVFCGKFQWQFGAYYKC